MAPNKITVEVALTAVSAVAEPSTPLALTDPNCAAPTANVPTCGLFLLKNGANGRVTLSIDSCNGLISVDDLRQCREVGDTQALVVTFIANLKNADGKPLYSKTHPQGQSSLATSSLPQDRPSSETTSRTACRRFP